MFGKKLSLGYILNLSACNISILTWPLYINSVINIGGWNSLPIAEARGALGSVPTVYMLQYVLSIRSPPVCIWLS